MANGPIKSGLNPNIIDAAKKSIGKKVKKKKGGKRFDAKDLSPEMRERMEKEIKRRNWND